MHARTMSPFCTGVLYLLIQLQIVCPGWQMEVVFAVHSCATLFAWTLATKGDTVGGFLSLLVLHDGLVYKRPILRFLPLPQHRVV